MAAAENDTAETTLKAFFFSFGGRHSFALLPSDFGKVQLNTVAKDGR